MRAADVRDLERYLTPAERAELADLVERDMAATPWRPLPGPQTMAYESAADVIGFGGAAGGGKGLALDTPIATPAGWTVMGALQVGDAVFDEAGATCRVTAVSEINHRPCFRLVFDDGSALVADDVHRWVTFDAKERAALTRRDPQWRAARRLARSSRAQATTSTARLAALAERNARCVQPLPAPQGTMRDTLTLASTLRAGNRANHAIRTAGALALPDAALPVPPYVLGAWLGDGSSRNGQITGEDAYIWERIGREGYEVRHYAHNVQAHNILGLKVCLRKLGVLENKHIPPAYLRASFTQRLALLQGLMDTDGHAALDGGCEFDNTNETLALGVRELAATLGIKSTLRRGTAKLNGRVIGAKWRVHFTTSLPVFGMPRKAERLNPSTRRTTGFRYLVACGPVESVATRCIAVDSASRQYLAGEQLIPTHNTDLAIGMALTRHHRTQIFRREGPQLRGIVDRLREIVGGSMITGNPPVYNDGSRQVEFNSAPYLGDETKYQGRPKDLLVIDEAANFLEQQVRFLKGWVRTTRPGQRTCTLMTFNPPTSADGRWVVSYFAPWLDKSHPLYPSGPGALRYVYVDPTSGVDVWIDDDDPRPFVLAHGRRVYDVDTTHCRPEDIVRPESRTFVPSRITDNPHLIATGYMAQLQALPEPLRSQMLLGDFEAGVEDDPWQVIPTLWVDAAMARWRERSPRGEMMAMGVDVARGGRDQTIISTRHKTDQSAMWFDRLRVFAGADTPNGNVVAGLVIGERRDHAPVHIDVIGVGASPYDVLASAGIDVYGVNVSERATAGDASGRLAFANLRTQLWWQMRELLDPASDSGICLPPDTDLARELCAPRWGMSGMTIRVEPRDDIVKRVGRSPDRASALILAAIESPKIAAIRALAQRSHESPLDYDPYARL